MKPHKDFLSTGNVFDVGLSERSDWKDVKHSIIDKMKGKRNSRNRNETGFWGQEKTYRGVNEFRAIVYKFKNIVHDKRDQYKPSQLGEYYGFLYLDESNEGLNVSPKSYIGMNASKQTNKNIADGSVHTFWIYFLSANMKYPDNVQERVRKGSVYYDENWREPDNLRTTGNGANNDAQMEQMKVMVKEELQKGFEKLVNQLGKN